MRSGPVELDATDRAIINALQEGFPLGHRPFARAAERLGLSEDDLIARIRRLREIGAITRFGPFFDAAAMGGAFCLCAMEVPEDEFERVMIQVNELDEVTRIHRVLLGGGVVIVEGPNRLDRIEGDSLEFTVQPFSFSGATELRLEPSRRSDPNTEYRARIRFLSSRPLIHALSAPTRFGLRSAGLNPP